jgi:hypothetical protein
MGCDIPTPLQSLVKYPLLPLSLVLMAVSTATLNAFPFAVLPQLKKRFA